MISWTIFISQVHSAQRRRTDGPWPSYLVWSPTLIFWTISIFKAHSAQQRRTDGRGCSIPFAQNLFWVLWFLPISSMYLYKAGWTFMLARSWPKFLVWSPLWHLIFFFLIFWTIFLFQVHSAQRRRTDGRGRSTLLSCCCFCGTPATTTTGCCLSSQDFSLCLTRRCQKELQGPVLGMLLSWDNYVWCLFDLGFRHSWNNFDSLLPFHPKHQLMFDLKMLKELQGPVLEMFLS